MYYYYAVSSVHPDVFGFPFPAPGVRVVFDQARLTAYGPWRNLPVVQKPCPERQGLTIFWTPLDVLTWPCRLWQVENPEDAFTISQTPFYLRCAAFTVVEEIPGWQVLGQHGEKVAQLEQQIGALTSAHAAAIAAQDGAAEWQAWLAVKNRWHDMVEAAPHEGRMFSPIGDGADVIRGAVDLAAARTSATLFDWIEYATDWPILADPAWRSTSQAATTTALAVGAPELLRDGEFELLTARWRAVFPGAV